MEQEEINRNEQEVEDLAPIEEPNDSYKYVFYATTACVATAALYVAWLYVSSDKDWGFTIEWSFWKSTVLWPILSVIGFFLQFINWQHMSFDEGLLVKKPDGKEEFYKNDDILSYLFGHVLWPLISHLFLIPCAYGAALYYIIMVPVALLNAILPYLAACLCILIIVYYFVIAKNFESKTPGKAYAFLSITTLLSLGLIWLLSLPTSQDFDFGDKSTNNTASTTSYNTDSSEYNNDESTADTYSEDYSEESNEEAEETTMTDSQDESETAPEETSEEATSESSSTEFEEEPIEVAEPTPPVQQAPKRPSREVRHGSLLRANVSSVSYSNGNVEINIVLGTPMVRRQFTVTGWSARDENNQSVSVSRVDVSGIQKERGHDYYILTDKDTVYLTVVIPHQPSTGFLKSVRVDMSLSGAREWVTVENIAW